MNDILTHDSQPAVQSAERLGAGMEPNTGSAGWSASLSDDASAVDEPVTWGAPTYQVTDDVKCSGYYCRDACQCRRRSVIVGEHHAALWARKDMNSARCEPFLEIVQ
jgi:hypothetical protein